MDNSEATMTPEELTELARKLSQKEWDKLLPPRESQEHEPADASGYTVPRIFFLIRESEPDST